MPDKKKKNSGQDTILNEHVHYAMTPKDTALRALFNVVLLYKEISRQWKTSVLIPLYMGKGKSRTDPASYRPVSLIPCFLNYFKRYY